MRRLGERPAVAASACSITAFGASRHVPFGRTGLHLGEIENIVDEAAEPLALLDDDADELLALLGSRSGLSRRISLNERIEVSGVRNSWLTVATKSSFSLSSSLRRSLAARSSAVAASSSRDFCSSWRE